MDSVKQRFYSTQCGIKHCKASCNVVEQVIINEAKYLEPFRKIPYIKLISMYYLMELLFICHSLSRANSNNKYPNAC